MFSCTGVFKPAKKEAFWHLPSYIIGFLLAALSSPVLVSLRKEDGVKFPFPNSD